MTAFGVLKGQFSVEMLLYLRSFSNLENCSWRLYNLSESEFKTPVLSV